MLRIVFTCGDINGIGPEISLKTIRKVFDPLKYHISFICPENVFQFYREKLKFTVEYEIVDEFNPSDTSKLQVVNLGNAGIQFGISNNKSGELAYNAVKQAADFAVSGKVDAIVTAPVSKRSLQLAGVDEPGHTEILAKAAKSDNYCMMFLSDNMIAGLTTIHIPINRISSSINKIKVSKIINLVDATLRNDLRIENPKIAVLGLNPHAGEEGKLGTEELEIIAPAINEYDAGNIYGPFVPDAFFANQLHKKYDAVIGMYHDQVLIPFKMLNFNTGVNFTAGLPIVRTSPDHGTAFDIAGKLIADSSSMTEAFGWAVKIAQNRKS